MKDFLTSAMQSQVMSVGILGMILAFLACRDRWSDARKVGVVLLAVVAVFYVYSAMLDRIELEEMIAKNDEAWHQLMDDNDHMPSAWGGQSDRDYPKDPISMTAQKDTAEGIQVAPNDDLGPGPMLNPMGPKDPKPTPMPTPEAGSSNHYDSELIERDLAVPYATHD